jgi:hypothetical protein
LDEGEDCPGVGPGTFLQKGFQTKHETTISSSPHPCTDLIIVQTLRINRRLEKGGNIKLERPDFWDKKSCRQEDS